MKRRGFLKALAFSVAATSVRLTQAGQVALGPAGGAERLAQFTVSIARAEKHYTVDFPGDITHIFNNGWFRIGRQIGDKYMTTLIKPTGEDSFDGFNLSGLSLNQPKLMVEYGGRNDPQKVRNLLDRFPRPSTNTIWRKDYGQIRRRD